MYFITDLRKKIQSLEGLSKYFWDTIRIIYLASTSYPLQKFTISATTKINLMIDILQHLLAHSNYVSRQIDLI